MARTLAAYSERTRRRILGAAASAFRERGIDGVGIREVMKRAGLTRGGFYFHFSDKDALLNEAVREAATGSAAEYVARAESAPPGKKLQTLIESYLSPEHRDHREAGCMVSALGSEAARGNTRHRAAFTSGIGIIVGKVSAYMPGATQEERVLKAGLLMSSMSGVLTVSRVLSDRASSDKLLAAARKHFIASFGGI